MGPLERDRNDQFQGWKSIEIFKISYAMEKEWTRYVNHMSHSMIQLNNNDDSLK